MKLPHTKILINFLPHHTGVSNKVEHNRMQPVVMWILNYNLNPQIWDVVYHVYTYLTFGMYKGITQNTHIYVFCEDFGLCREGKKNSYTSPKIPTH